MKLKKSVAWGWGLALAVIGIGLVRFPIGPLADYRTHVEVVGIVAAIVGLYLVTKGITGGSESSDPRDT